jgi:uncharacterized protein (TIGR00251 family)
MKCLTRLRNKNIALNVYVQPRASKNRLAGLHGDAIKVCITAPPVENKGNEAVMAFIADLFNVSKSAVSIKSGRQGRHKKIVIADLALADAEEILAGALAKTKAGAL